MARISIAAQGPLSPGLNDDQTHHTYPYLKQLKMIQHLLQFWGYHFPFNSDASMCFRLSHSFYNFLLIAYCLVAIANCINLLVQVEGLKISGFFIIQINAITLLTATLFLYIRSWLNGALYTRFCYIWRDLLRIHKKTIELSKLAAIVKCIYIGSIIIASYQFISLLAIWFGLYGTNFALFSRISLPFYSAEWTNLEASLVFFMTNPILVAFLMIFFAIYAFYSVLTYILYKHFIAIHDKLLRDAQKKKMLTPYARLEPVYKDKQDPENEADKNEETPDHVWGDLDLSIFERARLEHDIAMDALETVDDMFCYYNGLLLAITIGCVSLMIYGIARGATSAEEILSAAVTSIYAFVSNSIILYSGILIQAAVVKPLEVLYAVNLSKLDHKDIYSIQVMISRLTAAPGGYTAMKMFVITKESVLSIGGALVTYAIVMFQFPTNPPGNLDYINSTTSTVTYDK